MATTETTRKPGQSFIDSAFFHARRGDREAMSQNLQAAKRLGRVVGQQTMVRLLETLDGDR